MAAATVASPPALPARDAAPVAVVAVSHAAAPPLSGGASFEARAPPAA